MNNLIIICLFLGVLGIIRAKPQGYGQTAIGGSTTIRRETEIVPNRGIGLTGTAIREETVIDRQTGIGGYVAPGTAIRQETVINRQTGYGGMGSSTERRTVVKSTNGYGGQQITRNTEVVQRPTYG